MEALPFQKMLEAKMLSAVCTSQERSSLTVINITAVSAIKSELNVEHHPRRGAVLQFVWIEVWIGVTPGPEHHVSINWRLELIPNNRVHAHDAIPICQVPDNAFVCCCLDHHLHEDLVLSEDLHIERLEMRRGPRWYPQYKYTAIFELFCERVTRMSTP